MKYAVPTMKTILKYFLAVAACCSAILAQASQTLPSGSSLGLKAQVTGPLSSTTLNSTYAISSNDFVQWTAYFQSKMTSPFESDGVMTLPADFKWQNGSVFAPANTVLRWNIGGVWQTNEPPTGAVVAKVGWKTDPSVTITIQNAVAPAVSFSGTGDGYRVIAYKDKLFVVNHHERISYLNCRIAETGLPCPGFINGGVSIPVTAGDNVAHGADDQLFTPQMSIEHLNLDTGELFIYVGNTYGVVYMLCADLNTLKACMNAVKMDDSWYIANPGITPYYSTAQVASNPIGSVGSKYYALSLKNILMCFDVAVKAPCAGQPFDYGWTQRYTGWGYLYTSINMSTVMGGKLLVAWDHGKHRCVDTLANHAPCDGWPLDGTGYGSLAAMPVLNPDGTPKGVCNTVECTALNGTPFTPSDNYKMFLRGYLIYDPTLPLSGNLFSTGSGAFAQANTFGTRVFHSKSGNTTNYATCFDFATDAECPNFPVDDPLGRITSTYTVTKDLVRRNCMWSLGHLALAKSFDPLTGGDCVATVDVPPAIVLTVDPAMNYRCDPTAARVDKWGKIRFSPALSWVSNGLASVKVKIMDAAGNLLPVQYNPNRDFAYGALELSIADIPYALYPILKIELTLLANSLTVTANVGFDVTWEGDPTQLCFKTQAPAVSTCGLGADVALQTKAVHIPNYTETLNSSSGFTPNILQTGWGPRTSATTLNEVLTGANITQVLQTRFDMNNYTGDLWQFSFNSTGGLAGSPNYRARDNTGSRTFYTSTPGTGPAGMAVVPLNYNILSATQKAALNITLNGAADGLGEKRVKYLTDDRSLEATTFDIPGVGKLRKRTNNLLGPVIDSSPTVLFPRPLASFNELQYPNYRSFKNTSSRNNNTLALFAGNDGFLHGYTVSPTSGLAQAFSYMPSFLLKRVQTYTDASLAGAILHPYRLDNTPMLADVNLAASKTGNQWRTVVVGSQGRGGRGVYALDITSGKPDNVLFEYDNTSHPDLADLGEMQGQPPSDLITGSDQIVRIGSDARWAYVAGNGVNSNSGDPATSGTGRAVLYIFYLNGNVNGANARWKRISVNQSGSPDADLDFGNGLGTPRPVDTNGDGVVDLIYAGDKKGNLWRFNVSDLSNVTVTKIFKTATVTSITGQLAAPQHIYTAPVVQRFGGAGQCPASSSTGCWMVLFGTGGDVNGTITPLHTTNSLAQQHFYGIFDKGVAGATGLVDESSLTAQTLSVSGSTIGSTRTVSSNPVDYAGGKLGWKMALADGEHNTSNPELQPNGSVMFGSSRPAGMAITSCAPGVGWLTQLNVTTGTGRESAFGNAASIVINANTGLFAVPQALMGSTLNAKTYKLLISGDPLTGGAVSTITQATDSMLGRLSWREVFGAPK